MRRAIKEVAIAVRVQHKTTEGVLVHAHDDFRASLQLALHERTQARGLRLVEWALTRVVLCKGARARDADRAERVKAVEVPIQVNSPFSVCDLNRAIRRLVLCLGTLLPRGRRQVAVAAVPRELRSRVFVPVGIDEREEGHAHLTPQQNRRGRAGRGGDVLAYRELGHDHVQGVVHARDCRPLSCVDARRDEHHRHRTRGGALHALLPFRGRGARPKHDPAHESTFLGQRDAPRERAHLAARARPRGKSRSVLARRAVRCGEVRARDVDRGRGRVGVRVLGVVVRRILAWPAGHRLQPVPAELQGGGWGCFWPRWPARRTRKLEHRELIAGG
mmetsp:Transcript_11366/g.47506  ORF Transcript_11366/g.47506 Transcript_11366/m.47506 type:complete len:332 (-) Transcript_11366:1170-2165(-)